MILCPKCKSTDVDIIEISAVSNVWQQRNGELVSFAPKEISNELEYTFMHCEKCQHEWSSVASVTDIFPEGGDDEFLAILHRDYPGYEFELGEVTQ